VPSISVRAASIYQIKDDANGQRFAFPDGRNEPVTLAENHR
jgi:hypothetical protein